MQRIRSKFREKKESAYGVRKPPPYKRDTYSIGYAPGSADYYSATGNTMIVQNGS